MYCLHCGDCCKRMSPISAPESCPYIRIDGDYVFCSRYERRPEECIKHTFYSARFCPIGLNVLGLSYPKDLERIRDRIVEGHKKGVSGLKVSKHEQRIFAKMFKQK